MEIERERERERDRSQIEKHSSMLAHLCPPIATVTVTCVAIFSHTRIKVLSDVPQ